MDSGFVLYEFARLLHFSIFESLEIEMYKPQINKYLVAVYIYYLYYILPTYA